MVGENGSGSHKVNGPCKMQEGEEMEMCELCWDLLDSQQPSISNVWTFTTLFSLEGWGDLIENAKFLQTQGT